MGTTRDCGILERLMLKLQYFGHLMQRADSLKNTVMLGKIEGKRRSGRECDGYIALVTNGPELSKLWEIVEDREAWHAAVQAVIKTDISN